MTARKRPANRLRRRSDSSGNLQLRAWLLHHRYVLRDSLGQVIRRPVSSVLTWLVIGIALALPALMYVTDKNLRALAGQWQEGAQLTLYLTSSTDEASGRALTDSLRQRQEISSARFLSSGDALNEFSQRLSLDSALAGLDNNPLPDSIIIVPESQTRSDMEALGAVLSNLPEVDSLQYDIEWVQRLEQLARFLDRVLLASIAVLALTVILVVGNTMRMATEARRDEIQVVKLVGATASFVRRPFLYMGFWYGVFGGLAAIAITLVTLWWLRAPVLDLVNSYGAAVALPGLTVIEGLLLIALAVALSVGSTWLTVTRRINDIEPNPL